MIREILAASVFCCGLSSAASAQSSHILDAKSFGAICDGGSHPLETKFATLAAAQDVYPFVTSLNQQIDYAAIKAMSNTALGADGAEHGPSGSPLNLPMYIPPGVCEFGSDTWKVSKATGMVLTGGSMTGTRLEASGTVFQTDGLWYSTISNLQFATVSSGAIATVDIDGNVTSGMGVQGNTFSNIIVQANWAADYAFAFCREGGSSGQCSENILINPHFFSSKAASYYQNGFNALDNVIQGGDIQGFKKHGVHLSAGSVKIFGTSFEDTVGYQQILNGGCDISADEAGVHDSILVYGSRTEDLCFYRGAWSQVPDLRGITQLPAFIDWSARVHYPQYAIARKQDSHSNYHLYVVTTPGTSGAVEPTWPSSGSVQDGSAIWTLENYASVQTQSGWVDYSTSHFDPTGAIIAENEHFVIGTNFIGRASSYGLKVHGSNAATQAYVHAQGQAITIYANPQPTSQSLESGIPLSPASTGIVTSGDLILSSRSGNIELDLPTTCTGHRKGALWNNAGVVSVCQ